MKGIFISYRREDSAGYAGRLYDRLATQFGADNVFMDVEGIEPGVDFVDAIGRAVGSCEVLIVIIGREWLSAGPEGKRRIDDPSDFVRIETAAALVRGIRVVPVLVEGATMPRANELPTPLAALARRQAVELTHKQWDATTGELIRTLDKILAANKAKDADAGAARAESASVPQRSEAVAISGSQGNRRAWWIGAAALAVAAIGFALFLMQPWGDDDKPAARPGNLVVAPARLQFPDQPQRVASSPSTVTLTNDGQAPLRVSTPRLDGAVADFTLIDDQCSGRTLAAGASCTLKIAFSAQGVGPRSASLSFPTDPPNTIAVNLQGIGGAPLVAEAPRPVEKAPEAQPPPRPVEKAPEAQPPRPVEKAPAPVPPPERKAEPPVAAPRILSFEVRTANGRTELCYGVDNSVSASITPSPGAVKPLAKDCVPISADTTRTYTLTARNSAGAAVSRALTVEAPAAPPIQLVTVPNTVGKSRAQALAELAKAGLEVRIVDDKLDAQASGPVDSVVAQLPKAGEQLKPGGRVTLQIMPPAAGAPPVAASSPALPRVGDVWEYRSRSVWRNVEPRTYSHQVTAVSDREVRETMSTASSAGKVSESKAIGPDTRFVEWRGQGYYHVEFNPFIEAFGALKPGTAWKGVPIPVDDPFFGNWQTHGRATDWDTVSVPAGTFKALRVELNSHRAPTGSVAMRASEPVRILNAIWYAPEAKRAVKLVRTVYSTAGTRLDEETLELVKFRVQ